MDSTLSLLILAAVCIAIGYFSAVLITNLRAADSETAGGDQGNNADREGRKEVFRVWRTVDDHAVQLEIDGHLSEKAAEMKAEQHAVISLALVDLYSWMTEGASDAEPENTGEEPAQSGSSEPEPQAVESAEAQPVEGVEPKETEAAGDESAVEGADVEPEKLAGVRPDTARVSNGSEAERKQGVYLPSINIFKSLVHTARSEIKEKVEPGEESIAFQVDEILQTKLEASNLADQAVRLLDLPGQGMVILIGLEKFEEIEAVPDEEIKKLLRESVNEWETRMLGKRSKGS